MPIHLAQYLPPDTDQSNSRSGPLDRPEKDDASSVWTPPAMLIPCLLASQSLSLESIFELQLDVSITKACHPGGSTDRTPGHTRSHAHHSSPIMLSTRQLFTLSHPGSPLCSSSSDEWPRKTS
jgi:hypothetical protein